MKTIKFSTILAFAILFISCKEQKKSSNQAIDTSISKIEVIDFHASHRCMTCKAIEANTKYTLETYFSKELKANKITFQTINIDDDENKKIAEKFEASGTALFLNLIKNGKETQMDLTEFAFMNGTDQESFSKELKTKIETQLNSF